MGKPKKSTKNEPVKAVNRELKNHDEVHDDDVC